VAAAPALCSRDPRVGLLPEEPESLSGIVVAVVAGEGEQRRVAPVVESKLLGRKLIVRLGEAWRSEGDRRWSPRVPGPFSCILRAPDGDRQALLVDISGDGAALSIPDWPGGDVTLIVQFGRWYAEVTIEPLEIELDPAGVLARVRFVDVDVESGLLLAALVEWLREGHAAA